MKLSWKQSFAIATVTLLILAAGLGWFMKQHRTTAPSSVRRVSSPAQRATSSNDSPYAGAELYKVGDTVHFQNVDLRVNTVDSRSSINSSYSSPLFADPGTKFVVFNLTVTNTTSEPFAYQSFALVDQKDRLYDGYADAIGNIDDYLDGAELAPGVPKTGNAVYQVPVDSTTVRLGGRVGSTERIRLVRAKVD